MRDESTLAAVLRVQTSRQQRLMLTRDIVASRKFSGPFVQWILSLKGAY